MRWSWMVLLSAFLAFGCGDSSDDGSGGSGGVGTGGTGGTGGPSGDGGSGGDDTGEGGAGGEDGTGGNGGDDGDGGKDQEPFSCVEGADKALFAMVNPDEGRLTWNEDLAPGDSWVGVVSKLENNRIIIVIPGEDPEGADDEEQAIEWPDGELGRLFPDGTNVTARWQGEWFEVTDGTYTAALHYSFSLDDPPKVEDYGPFSWTFEESCEYQVGTCDPGAYFDLIVTTEDGSETLQPTHSKEIDGWVVSNRGAALRVGSEEEPPACTLSFFGSAITVSSVVESGGTGDED